MRKSLFCSLAVLVLQLVGAVSSEAQGRRWGEGYFPNLPVVTQDGQQLRFFDDVIKDRIVVISFIYTSCTDICPLTTARLAQVAEKLGDRVGRDIFLVSITVDPKRDTPEKLKAYATAFHSGPGWSFLTGTLADIRAINSKLGEHMRSLNDHRNEIVLGNDATGEWARNSLFGDLERVVLDIHSMDPKWRNEVRTIAPDPASNTGYKMSDQPGQALYKRMCAACHTIKVGNRVGPDLYGVAARRQHTWLMSFIMDPDKMRNQKDATALTLVAKYPAVRMPNLGLTEHDATDLIAYLKAQTNYLDAERLEAAKRSAAHHNHNHRH